MEQSFWDKIPWQTFSLVLIVLGTIAGGVGSFKDNKLIRGLIEKNNTLADQIVNEQKERGVVLLKTKNYERYTLLIGGNRVPICRDSLIEGHKVNFLEDLTGHTLLRLKENTILISTSVYDYDDNLIIELNEGKWALNKSDYFSINYDSTGLEIINKKGHIQFQLDLVDDVIILNGIYYKGNNINILSKGLFVKENTPANSAIITDIISKLDRNFKHLGDDYLGIRSEIYLNNEESRLLRIEKIKDRKAELSKLSNTELIANGNSWIKTLEEFYSKEMEIIKKANFSKNSKGVIKKDFKPLFSDINEKYRSSYMVPTVALKYELLSRNVDGNQSNNYEIETFYSYSSYEMSNFNNNIIEELSDLIDKLKKL